MAEGLGFGFGSSLQVAEFRPQGKAYKFKSCVRLLGARGTQKDSVSQGLMCGVSLTEHCLGEYSSTGVE